MKKKENRNVERKLPKIIGSTMISVGKLFLNVCIGGKRRDDPRNGNATLVS